ncbi:MAG TPA: hypothetical protein P5163_20105 [Rubrivivax sp.]|nr:hypothetical protein [Rubrivivax sp.]HRZ62895.1 hypothetical protein [Rubrivivax sp.]
MRGRLHTATAEVDRLLADPKAKPSTVKARLHAVENLAVDIKHWCGWPALVASLTADAERLRERLR